MKREMMITMKGDIQTLDRSRGNGRSRYDSAKNKDNKAYIRLKAEQIAEREGIVTPIPAGNKGYAISITAFMAVPKTFPKWKRKLVEEGKLKPFRMPDLDNHGKLWLDSLVQGGIIEDDRKVTSLTIHKLYSMEDVEFSVCRIWWEEEDE